MVPRIPREALPSVAMSLSSRTEIGAKAKGRVTLKTRLENYRRPLTTVRRLAMVRARMTTELPRMRSRGSGRGRLDQSCARADGRNGSQQPS